MKICPKMMPKMSGVQRVFVTFKKKTFFKELPYTEKVFPSGKVTYFKNFNACSFHLNFYIVFEL
jgi:hypothetical protein